MTNQKTMKRAMLTSVMAMLLCLSMLVGTTFAWFTDSVTSTGNVIKTGVLDVQLLMDTGAGYVDISDSEKPIFGAGSVAQNNNAETLWETGKTQVAYLAIKNNGNLDLKYTVKLNVQNVDKNVYEVMEYAIVPDAQYGSVTSWTSGNPVAVGTQSVSGDVALKVDETHYFALAIHMDENAGTEYQGGQVNFDLTVLATQLNSESDAFGSDYDMDAEYAIIVNSDASLHSALAAGGNVIIDGEIDNEIIKAYSNGNTRELYLNSESSEITLSGGKIILDENATYGLYPYAKGNPITVKDMEVESNAKFGIVAWPSTVTDLVTIENVDVNAAGGVGIYAYGPGKTVVNNCTVGQSGLSYAETPWANTAIAASTRAVFEINGGEYTGADYVLWIYNSGATVTINGGTFNGAIRVDAGSVTINAGTFSVDPSTVSGVTVNGTVVDNGDGTWTVTAAN